MFRKIYSSMAAGGGVHGKGDGTALIIMTEAGVIIEAYRLSTETFLPAGEMISEIAVGRDIRGKVSGYSIRIFSAIGKAGKKTGIGNRKHGEYRDCLPEISREIFKPVNMNPVSRRVDKGMVTIREKADRKDMIEDRTTTLQTAE
jgi:hypothetical protein